LGTGKPGNGEGEIVQRRTVVVVCVVCIGSLFQQDTEACGLVCLIVVHRPVGQMGQAQSQRGDQDEQEQDGHPFLHGERIVDFQSLETKNPEAWAVRALS